jgi:cytochrome c553
LRIIMLRLVARARRAVFTGLVATAPLAAAGAEELRTPLIAQSCAGCHGQKGSGMGRTPSIAGYDRDDFLLVWREFRSGERPSTVMGRIARGYTEAEVAALADYFSQR